MRSIQTRLATGLLLSLIVLLLVQWLIVANSIEKLSEQYIASRLVHSSDLLVAAISQNKSGEIILDNNRIDPVYSKPFSGYYYHITVGQQNFRSRSLWDETLPHTSTDIGSSSTSKIAGPQQQQLMLLNTAYKKQNYSIQVTVAEDISDITHDIQALLINHGIVSLIILVILISIQAVIVRKSMLPLDNTRKDLVKLEKGDIQSLDENVPREILALVKEINLRVAAFQQRLERSRRATGNLAHALKTPLTLLRQLADEDILKQSPRTQETLLHYTNTIQQTIDRELKRARLAGTAIGTRQTDLKPEVNALIQSLQAMYREKALDISLTMPDQCTSSMDREDFHEMLGNILDNACKWAKQKVTIMIHCEKGLVISVDDDGKGIPPEQTELILNRGTRLDEQIAGHGLGLAIVKDIIDQYKGTLTLSNSETLGGLKMKLSIPTYTPDEDAGY